ncbi:MAG: lysostaphin resistance A-like protein [Candidatus Odinarchaeota archaeon]
MICPNCSHSHSYTVKTCPNCGVLQPSAVTVNKVLPEYQDKWKPAAFLLPVVILTLAGPALTIASTFLVAFAGIGLPSFNNEVLDQELTYGLVKVVTLTLTVVLYLRINQYVEKKIPVIKSLFAEYRGIENQFSVKVLLVILTFFILAASFFITIHLYQYGFILLNVEISQPIYLHYLEVSDQAITVLIEGIGIVLIAPVVEEITYRGLILRASEDAKMSSTSIYALQFIMFALIHVSPSDALIYQLIQFTWAGFAAIIFTWLYRKTGNIIYPITAHFLWNLQSTTRDLAVASGYLDQAGACFFAISFISLVICGGFLLYWLLKSDHRKYLPVIPRSLDRAEIKLFFLCAGVFTLNRLLVITIDLTSLDVATIGNVLLLLVLNLGIILPLVVYLAVKGTRLHNIPHTGIPVLQKYWTTPVYSLSESDFEKIDFPAEVKEWFKRTEAAKYCPFCGHLMSQGHSFFSPAGKHPQEKRMIERERCWIVMIRFSQ